MSSYVMLLRFHMLPLHLGYHLQHSKTHQDMHLHTIVVWRWRVPPVLTPWHYMAADVVPVVAAAFCALFFIILFSSFLPSAYIPTPFPPSFPTFPATTPTLRSPNIIRDIALHTSGSIGVVPHGRCYENHSQVQENHSEWGWKKNQNMFRVSHKHPQAYIYLYIYKWIGILSYCKGVIYSRSIHDLQWRWPDVVKNSVYSDSKLTEFCGYKIFIEIFGVSRGTGLVPSILTHPKTLAESSNHCSPNRSGPCHLALRHQLQQWRIWQWHHVSMVGSFPSPKVQIHQTLVFVQQKPSDLSCSRHGKGRTDFFFVAL